MEDKLSGIPEEQKKDELANYYSMESRLLRMKRAYRFRSFSLFTNIQVRG